MAAARWGARLKFDVAGIGLYAFYNYETGNIRGGLGKNNPYEGVPVETRLAQLDTQRFKYTIGPASQIVVAEQITTTSMTREFGLRLEPPGGGAPFVPTKAYSDTQVTLYVVDNPAPGEWIARLTIAFMENGKEKRIPVFGRRRMTFASRAQADAYGFELAKLWIDGRLWGTDGHG